MRWITQSGDEAGRGRPNTQVVVNTTLNGLESVQLDQWVAAHLGEVVGVEIDATSVFVHTLGPDRSTIATATAPRIPGQLVDALNEALQRLITDEGSP